MTYLGYNTKIKVMHVFFAFFVYSTFLPYRLFVEFLTCKSVKNTNYNCNIHDQQSKI